MSAEAPEPEPGPDGYRVRLDRTAMGALAVDADIDLLDAAAELLHPLMPLLDADLVDLDAPAVTFDPGQAAGPTRRTGWEPPNPPPATIADPPTETELPWLSACDLVGLIRNGQLSTAEVVRRFARRAESLGPELNAFITVTADAALRAVRDGGGSPAGRLAGLPIGIKDIIDTAGVRTTCGSRIHADRVPARDADCWRRLRDEGALLLGKTNTHEFAAGVTSQNDHFGTVRNPWSPDRIAGGSSGGSAVAVSAGLVPAAIGTDTGGSIRIPAGCCGVVGLKPTFGLVPTSGVHPLAWSLDHVGPLARTVRDAALLLDVLAGTDCEPAARAGSLRELAGIRIAVPAPWIEDAEPDVRSDFAKALGELRRCGAVAVEAPHLPALDQLTAVNRVIAYAEGSAVHERHLRLSAGFGPAIRPRQEAGRFLLAGHYLTAQRLRGLLCRPFSEVWRVADVLALPVLPCPAPRLAADTVQAAGRDEPVGTACIRFTGPINLAGLPAVTVPSGSSPDGMPLGLQIVGPAHANALVCFVAAAAETAEQHHPPGIRGMSTED